MIYRLISRAYPKKFMLRYKQILDYANVKVDPYRFAGFILAFGFILAWFFAFALGAMFKFNILLTFLISFVGFEITVYMLLLLSVDAKAKLIEKSLPDALQLMASNLKAGLTPEKAFLLAARPEFGPLSDEISRVGKEITVGKDVDVSFINMTHRVNSDKLKKTVLLIVSGLRSGGELASLLEQTARNLRDQEFVDQKIRSSIRMYIIFIFSAICIGAPLLYALSSFLVEVLTNVLAQVEIPKSTAMNLPITITKVSITPSFVMTYIITSLSVTCILGSLMLGLISKGQEKYGFKLIPLLLGISLAVFFMVRLLISSFMSGLFSF